MGEEVVAGLRAAGVICILRGVDPERVQQRAHELVSLGARAIEVTLDTPDALPLLAQLADHLPSHIWLGAGTVMRPEQVAQCAELGVRYALSPVAPAGFVAACLAAGIVPIPGAATPSEVWTAAASGAPLVKLYPASSWTPRDLARWPAPLRAIHLVPTGGVAPDQLAHWFELPQVAAMGMGGALVGTDLRLGSDADVESTAAAEADWATTGRSRAASVVTRWSDRPGHQC